MAENQGPTYEAIDPDILALTPSQAHRDAHHEAPHVEAELNDLLHQQLVLTVKIDKIVRRRFMLLARSLGAEVISIRKK